MNRQQRIEKAKKLRKNSAEIERLAKEIVRGTDDWRWTFVAINITKEPKIEYREWQHGDDIVVALNFPGDIARDVEDAEEMIRRAINDYIAVMRRADDILERKIDEMAEDLANQWMGGYREHVAYIDIGMDDPEIAYRWDDERSIHRESEMIVIANTNRWKWRAHQQNWKNHEKRKYLTTCAKNAITDAVNSYIGD